MVSSNEIRKVQAQEAMQQHQTEEERNRTLFYGLSDSADLLKGEILRLETVGKFSPAATNLLAEKLERLNSLEQQLLSFTLALHQERLDGLIDNRPSDEQIWSYRGMRTPSYQQMNERVWLEFRIQGQTERLKKVKAAIEAETNGEK